jgi:predicted nucleic acid-binding protein
MIVVADASPINYLILIEDIDILSKMYGRVVIPHAVYEELLRPSAPEVVRNWIGQMPSWLEIIVYRVGALENRPSGDVSS